MRTRTPLELHGSAVEGHPALRAWSALPAARVAPASIEVWREKKPTSIYRLLFEEPAMPAVFAKHCDAASGELQRVCHESILPRLPIASPRYHGSHQDPDETWWLFLDDVGREAYSVQDPKQRRLAGLWIGGLHRHGASIPAAADLPAAGLPRYREHLLSGRDHIRANLGNRALTAADRDMLTSILRLQDRAEARWNGFERALRDVPPTLVHGDFQPKNIRIHRNGTGPTLYAFDWELAGWGLAAVDLAPANGHDLSIQVDLDSYLDEVCREWPHLDAASIRVQVALGHVLRRLAAVDWASHSLHFERADHLSDPVASLRSIHGNLERALDETEEWLG